MIWLGFVYIPTLLLKTMGGTKSDRRIQAIVTSRLSQRWKIERQISTIDMDGKEYGKASRITPAHRPGQ